ncbi:endophilin-B1 [Haplochromis burtoni]|uniref:Endophilin-B1-like n=1 Tax=Haplochromis burtoni TaxID=8153 RepID=A0A3Q3C3G9_HAPBU|nr:endophilin-B1 [Haplochromis burtoni]
MDLTRLAVDAGQFINRAVQYTGESLGQAERTELDPGLEELLSRADATKTWTDQIISQTEALLQPSLGVRLEDRLYQHLEWSVPPRPRAVELLGDQMTQAGLEIGSNTPYGTGLIRCGEAQKQLGEAERKFVQSTNIHFLTPLRSFTEGEYKAIQNERKMLVNKRLDLDITKARLRKAHEAEQEARNLNANPLEEDYLSHVSYMFSFLRVKWLKIWAQEISQAEMELRICQSLYNRQSEITRAVVEGLSNTHTNHMRSLTDFVDAQASYYAQCNQHAQELQKQLASIPAVFCSNNWQSAISNPVSQPSTSNHEANEPISANHVTPLPVLVHQLPDFDQDSWTLNSPPQTVKTTADSSFSALLTHQTNNNNNNIIISTTRQTPSNHAPIYSQSTTVRAIDRVSTPNQTDQLQAPGRTARMSDASPASIQVLTFNTTASISNGAATAASPPLQPSATCSINEGDVQESSSGHQDVGQ